MMNFDESLPASHPPSQPSPASIAKIAAALARAQSKIVPPQLNKTVEVLTKAGRKYTFDYADLSAITEAIKGPLSENEISWTHVVRRDGNRYILITMLMHSSGEILESEYPLPSIDDPKDFGGAMTYGKRYSLSALTGCVADADTDDASDPNKETQNFSDRKPAVKPKGQDHPPAPTPLHPPTEPQIKRLFTIAGVAGWSNEQVKLYMEARWKIDSTKKLTREQYDQICELMQTTSYEKAFVGLVGKGQDVP